MTTKAFFLGAIFGLLVGPHALAQQESEAREGQQGSQGNGSNVEMEQYQDWVLRCEDSTPERAPRCALFQRLTMRESDRVILQTAIALPNGPEQPPLAVFTVPLGIYLPFGAELTIDDGRTVPMQIERCLRGGCQAILLLDDNMLQRLTKGSTARLTLSENQDEEVELKLSLKGFSAGIEALRGN